VKRVDLKDLLEADKPDRAAIDSKLQEISTARLALEKSAVHYRFGHARGDYPPSNARSFTN